MLVVMGARTAISVEEYLQTSFRDLDREYRNGEVVERNLPDYLHGKVQGLLFMFFAMLRKKLAVYPCTETRMRVAPDIVLIPDVAVFYGSEPKSVPDSPPLIVIEILSPDDRLTAVREKLENYKAWGVAHVWLADPHARRLYTCDAGLNEVARYEIPDLDLVVTPNDVFDWN